MDWNVLGTLGTWAAVLVALGIALKDTLERWKERTVRHILTAANILPEITQSRRAFETLLDESEPEALPEPSAEEIREVCDRFQAAAQELGLQHLTGYADQVGALPEHILVPLVKAMTMARMLSHNGSIAQATDWADTDSGLRHAMQEWRDQGRSIATSLEWVEQGVERLMRSRRWSKPETLGW